MSQTQLTPDWFLADCRVIPTGEGIINRFKFVEMPKIDLSSSRNAILAIRLSFDLAYPLKAGLCPGQSPLEGSVPAVQNGTVFTFTERQIFCTFQIYM